MDKLITIFFLGVLIGLTVALIAKVVNYENNKEACRSLDQNTSMDVKMFCEALSAKDNQECLKLEKLDQRMACMKWRF